MKAPFVLRLFFRKKWWSCECHALTYFHLSARCSASLVNLWLMALYFNHLQHVAKVVIIRKNVSSLVIMGSQSGMLSFIQVKDPKV